MRHFATSSILANSRNGIDRNELAPFSFSSNQISKTFSAPKDEIFKSKNNKHKTYTYDNFLNVIQVAK